MTVWLVTRRGGAAAWVRRRQAVDRVVDHLAPAEVAAGDVVIGDLPPHRVAELQARGARFRSLELDADEMERLGARLVAYRVERVGEVG